MLKVRFLQPLGKKDDIIFNTTDTYDVFKEDQKTIYVLHNDEVEGQVYYTGFSKCDEGTVFEFVN